MVQRKAAQKSKSNAVPVSKVPKKPVKPATLSNGFGNAKSKQSQNTKALERKDNTEITTPVAETSEETSNTNILESKSADSDISNQTKPGTSNAENEGFPEIQQPSSSEEKAKSKEITEDVAKPGKSRKRKLATIKEPKSSVKKETSAKSKTKAKKQKIVLEVPPLKSIPGKVFVVGENDVGQLGLDEDVDSKERPFLLDLPYSIVDVAAGGMHSVCLTENGEVITFGCNDEGALGRVTSEEEERIPRRVDIPEKIVQISAGDSHSAALAESGQVYLWGNFRNGEGQMGLTADGKKSVAPIKVLNDTTVVKIASGGDHLACLSSNGAVYTCGCGEQGQLGRINSRSCRDGGRKGLAALLEPAPVDRLTPRIQVNDVWTESYATFLKTQENGSIYAFGLNNYSQLGFENESSQQEFQMKFFPEAISSFNNRTWQQLNGGQHHTLALDSNGLVYSLGRKDYGRLGLGSNCEDTPTPTAIPTLQSEKCNSISCGNCVSFAVTEQGSLYSWGMGSSQLGQGDDEDIQVPRLIGGELKNSWEVYKVSGGGQHALILACPKKASSKTKKA